MANQQQSKLDLRPLFDTIENVKQKIALMETYDQRLGMLGLSFLFCAGVEFLLIYWCLSRGSGATVSQLQLLARKGFLLAFSDQAMVVHAASSRLPLLHNISRMPVALQGQRAGLGQAGAL